MPAATAAAGRVTVGFDPRDVSALRMNASPFSWLGCSAATLISKLTDVPFCVVPFSTAAGCGSVDGGAFAAGTGTMPSAESADREDDGSEIGTMVFAGADADVDALRAAEPGVADGVVVVAGEPLLPFVAGVLPCVCC